ncbi:hypothetical protein HYH02_011580 [Chlamydomonas schloesseri]|uniref:Uncharacterized protein n=1 Tax=Chlamydomonas schloesseri TaxID=2026947 RepID=A0A835T943_9CHLO|nr:hypothetical protein HYH02_011580 [Chlamydomonas schloesseri]|eukprot:KAG2436069.1 hypothetical protein HYH02_011580 [Chlamydomonas schloesseri]
MRPQDVAAGAAGAVTGGAVVAVLAPTLGPAGAAVGAAAGAQAAATLAAVLDPHGTRPGRRSAFTTTEADVVGHTEPVRTEPGVQGQEVVEGQEHASDPADDSAALMAAAPALVGSKGGSAVSGDAAAGEKPRGIGAGNEQAE